MLGIALNLHLLVKARRSESNKIRWTGEGINEVPTDQHNLLLQAARKVAADACFELQVDNQIPIGRGLGSSAASIVAGLLLSARLCNRNLTNEELLQLAHPLEGHLDNIAASINGGLTLVTTGSPPHITRLKWPASWRPVLFIADRVSPTDLLRSLVPEHIPRHDAVFNFGRIAEWVLAIKEADSARLARAMEDQLHQPYRKQAYPYLDDMIKAARAAGAFGAALSGAGGSLIAIVERDPIKEEAVGKAMLATANEHEERGRILVTDVDDRGASFAYE